MRRSWARCGCVAMKDGCDPITSAKLALQLRATQLGHAQLGGPQAGGAQPCGARLDVGLLDRTSLPLVMPALLIGKGRENHCVQLPREEVHPRAMTGENTISVGKSPCLR